MQVNVQTAPAVFNFAHNLSLRVFDANGNPWFVAADIEKMFGLTNLRKRITSLDDDEKTTIASPSGGSLTLVNESGMWTLVLRSDAAIQKGTVAYKARKWVTSEVLPAIRRNGHYELPSDTITPTEQHAIQVAVAKRARRTASNYQTIYRAIKNRYQIARYDQLPRSQFQDCIEFISCVDLSVPEVSKRDPAEDHGAVLTKEQTENLLYFLYCINYLFKDEFVMIYKLLRAVNSSHAARFFEMFQNFAGYKLERDLERQGFSVKETDCYKHWASTYAS